MDLPSATEANTGLLVSGRYRGSEKNAGFLHDLENTCTEQATEQATEMCPSAVLDQLGNSVTAQLHSI